MPPQPRRFLRNKTYSFCRPVRFTIGIHVTQHSQPGSTVSLILLDERLNGTSEPPSLAIVTFSATALGTRLSTRNRCSRMHDRKSTQNKNKINNLYLPSAVFIAQMLVGASKQLKQIFQTEHNIVKNPNWPEANQLAIYKRGLRCSSSQVQVRELRFSSSRPQSLRLARVVCKPTTKRFGTFAANQIGKGQTSGRCQSALG